MVQLGKDLSTEDFRRHLDSHLLDKLNSLLQICSIEMFKPVIDNLIMQLLLCSEVEFLLLLLRKDSCYVCEDP